MTRRVLHDPDGVSVAASQPRFVVRKGAARRPGREQYQPRWYWTLLAKNGEIVATSELYTRKRDAIRGAASAQLVAVEAVIVDETKPRRRR